MYQMDIILNTIWLNRNWSDICDNLKCERQKILLVSTVPTKEDEDQKLAGEMAFCM